MKNSSKGKISETETLDCAVDTLENEGIVAFPTETYYGLGVDPYSEKALKRLFSVKKRPVDKPVLVLVDGREMLNELADNVPDCYVPLMDRYWPGPLTLLFPARRHLSAYLTGGTGTVGIRLSPHPLVARLLKVWGKPITATSANIAGEKPATTASAVAESFVDAIDYIIDGGSTPGGMSSTILGCASDGLRLVRKGRLAVDLENIWRR